MPEAELPIRPDTLPPGVCYASEQARLNAFSAHQVAILTGQSFYNFGPDKPAIENQGFPWLRSIDMRWYYFEGQWITPRDPIDQDPNTRRLYVGSLTDLETYDGGEAGAVSDRTGPFWKEDKGFQGRSPMGPGIIPDENPVKTLTVEEDYGAGARALNTTQIPAHTHILEFNPPGDQSGSGFPTPLGDGSLGGNNYTTSSVGSTQPVNLTHTVRGIYVIMPTARIYRVIP